MCVLILRNCTDSHLPVSKSTSAAAAYKEQAMKATVALEISLAIQTLSHIMRIDWSQIRNCFLLEVETCSPGRLKVGWYFWGYFCIWIARACMCPTLGGLNSMLYTADVATDVRRTVYFLGILTTGISFWGHSDI